MEERAEYMTGSRKTEPQPLSDDRQPAARQPMETQAAYRGWLAYLEYGSIRKAATATGLHRTTLARYSKRWRWPERARLTLASHVIQWQDLLQFEETYGLAAATTGEEVSERWMMAYFELRAPDIETLLAEAWEALEQAELEG